MRIYGFSCPYTEACYRWFIESSQVDVDEMVKFAFGRVMKKEGFNERSDISYLAEECLAEIIKEVLEKKFFHCKKVIGYAKRGEQVVPIEDDSFIDKMSFITFGNIDFNNIARALLITVGKWNPEREDVLGA